MLPDNLPQLLMQAMSGEGRLVAAALLSILLWLLRAKIGPVQRFLAKDSGWLTAARKHQATAFLLAFAPAVALLADGKATLNQVGMEALTIFLTAIGLGAVAHKEPEADTEPEPPEQQPDDEAPADADVEDENEDAD